MGELATEVPILIRSLDQSQTHLLLRFLVDCGSDRFAATGLSHPGLPGELIQLFSPDAVQSISGRRQKLSGVLDSNTIELLTRFFQAGLLLASQRGFHAQFEVRHKDGTGPLLRMLRDGSSILLERVNDLQAEALLRLGVRFQVSPLRPDWRPKEIWRDYTSANVYVKAPPEVSLKEENYDNRRWIGGHESFGIDWFDCLKNEFIQRWWTPAHDQLLADTIVESGMLEVPTDELVAITDPVAIRAWREEDWRCHRWAWYNILAGFAEEKAKALGLVGDLPRAPKWVVCQLCLRYFHQSRATRWLYREQQVVCPECFRNLVWRAPEPRTRDEMIKYFRAVHEILGGVPHSDFGTQSGDFAGVAPENVAELVRLVQTRPALSQVKQSFGSWFGALVASEVLEEDSQRMTRGTRCFAKDGHTCLSLGEKFICDFLHLHGVDHEKEVLYPGQSNYRADWRVGPTYVEYFGLAGDPKYDSRIRLKLKYARDSGLTVLGIYPRDLREPERLREKLAIATGSGWPSPEGAQQSD